jgi:cation transport regulator ChaB
MRAVDAIRRTLPYTTAALLAAFLYSGWTMYSRWSDRREAERQETEARVRADAEVVRRYAGGDVRILHFYASPGTIARGAKGLLCYGVVSAKSVRIAPEVERLTPTLNRCFEIAPAKDTEYTLTAEDGAGKSATESILVRVR